MTPLHRSGKIARLVGTFAWQFVNNCRTVAQTRTAPPLQQLLENDITPSVIKSHPWLLTGDWSKIQPRIEQLRRIGINETTVPLLKIPVKRLEAVTDMWVADEARFKSTGTGNRLMHLGKLLDCTPAQVANMAVRHTPLLTFELDRVERVLELLLNNGISVEDIKKDLWILRHNEEMIQDRFQRAAEVHLPNIKTWMLRCQEITFEKTLYKWTQAKAILRDHDDIVDYLAARLNCSHDYMLIVAKRNPRLLTINVPKLKQSLDFLFANGFDSTLVCMQPRVMNYSITTLQQRLQELRNFGFKPPNLDILCMSVKRYEKLRASLSKKLAR